MKLSIKHIRNIFWLLVSFTWIILFFINYDADGIRWSELVRNNGRLAWYLMTLTIAMGLSRKIFKYPWLRKIYSVRKHTGIFAFLVASSHFIFELTKRFLYFDTSVGGFIKNSFSTDNAMIFGTLAYLIMLPAFITSTNWAIIKIGAKKWKLIQRLVHITFVFAGLHFALISYFSYQVINLEPIITLSVYFLSYLALFIYKKRKTNV